MDPHKRDVYAGLLIIGGEIGIRTLGPFGSLVFKTSSLNHSDISPNIF